MKTCLLFAALAAAALPVLAHAAAPSAPVSGDLIKGSRDTVYYFGADGRRYVFPTRQTYASWYGDFSTVKTISDDVLSTFPLGGNVTYRAGSRLVKITTDPKVYAVGQGGSLHWVQTEAVAGQLYGNAWAKHVDDVPDAFFINYTTGYPIMSAGDYQPALELGQDASINLDKQLLNNAAMLPPLPATPSPTSTQTAPTSSTPIIPPATPTAASSTPFRGVILSSNPNPRPGDNVLLTAQTTLNNMLSQIKIFFDNVLQTTCTFNPCTVNVTLPTSGVKAQYDIRGTFDWLTGQNYVATSSLATAANTNTGISLQVTRPEVQPGTYREVVVTIDNSFSARTIDIYFDGQDIKGCTNQNQCRYSDLETSPTGTVHTVYAIARDTIGGQRVSDTKTISVVNNDHPIVTATPEKNLIYRNESLTVSVTASDGDDTVSSTELWLDGTRLKACVGSMCSLQTGPWPQARSLIFVGHAIDAGGLQGWATSTSVTVQ